jgi:hypothetical protein
MYSFILVVHIILAILIILITTFCLPELLKNHANTTEHKADKYWIKFDPYMLKLGFLGPQTRVLWPK